MRLPLNTSFLFVCAAHNVVLSGNDFPITHRPNLKHPDPEARAVWVFDLEHMRCPAWNQGVENTSNGLVAQCRPTWEARIQESNRHILAGLRMYGDALAECVRDKALPPEDREGFEADSNVVECLIRKFDY